MKRRQGFVSNSSSSSFICDVTGDDYSGWDACLSEAEMCTCKNGHTFNDDLLKGGWDDAVLQHNIDWYNENMADKNIDFTGCDSDEKYEELTGECVSDDDFRYYVPARCCPICSLEYITDTMVLEYVTKTAGTSTEEFKTIIKGKFNSIDDLRNYKG